MKFDTTIEARRGFQDYHHDDLCALCHQAARFLLKTTELPPSITIRVTSFAHKGSVRVTRDPIQSDRWRCPEFNAYVGINYRNHYVYKVITEAIPADTTTFYISAR